MYVFILVFMYLCIHVGIDICLYVFIMTSKPFDDIILYDSYS